MKVTSDKGDITLDEPKYKKESEASNGEKKHGWSLKDYVVIALVVFVTFCCCILFFFMIYR